MAKEEKHRVVVRRHPASGGGGHGGGGWKIAYADFMTAMMAFFLVMWLLASATPRQLQGVAEHFRMPLRTALDGGRKTSLGTSVIPGGGADPARKDGDVAQSAAEDQDSSDAQALQAMKDRLEQLIESSPVFQQFRSQLLVDITTEGLRLQIVDSDNRPMFDLASARVVPHMRAILREIAPMLNDWPNKVTLSGHTDAIVYANGDRSYSNWELSADRANASRRELAAGGLREAKVLRVMGLADSMHLDQANPRNPINRRISIIVLNNATQHRIERENSGQPAAPLKWPGLAGASQRPAGPAPAVQVSQGNGAPAAARQ